MKKDTRSANVRSPLPVATSPVNTPEEVQALLQRVSTNSAKVEFPRDTWGFTSAFKKEALRAASGIQGQPDKHQLFLNTLEVIRLHVEARFESDTTFKADQVKQRIRSENERITRTQVFGVKPKVETPTQEPKL